MLRVEQRMAGMADLKVSRKIQREHNLDSNVTVERHDTTIRYKPIPFQNPDEAMILPESIDTLIVVRGGLESTAQPPDIHRLPPVPHRRADRQIDISRQRQSQS